jgi:hypothetical protein
MDLARTKQVEQRLEIAPQAAAGPLGQLAADEALARGSPWSAWRARRSATTTSVLTAPPYPLPARPWIT